MIALVGRLFRLGLSAFALLAFGAARYASALGPITNAFTYQAELTDAGTPVSGVYDLRFRIFDSPSGGTQVGPALCVDNLNVVAGRFSILLDFGAIFSDQQRYLEIQVRTDNGHGCEDVSGFTLLPRQLISAAPSAAYAIASGSAQSASFATSAGDSLTLAGHPPSYFTNAGNLTGILPNGSLSGTYSGALSLTNPANVLAGNGALLTSLNVSNITSGILSDDRLSANIPRLNTPNTWGPFTNTFFSMVVNNTLTASFLTGNGSGLTALNASNFSSGILSESRLSSNIPRLNTANAFGASPTTFAGRVGISVDPGSALHVVGNGGITLGANPSCCYNTALVIDLNQNSGGYAFIQSIKAGGSFYGSLVLNGAGGDVGIGMVPNGFRLDVAGGIRAASFSSISMREFKDDIEPLSDPLGTIMHLRGVSYTWNSQAPAGLPGKRDIGFVADEVAQAIPEIVATDSSGKALGIDYGKVTPLTVEAIKALKLAIDAQTITAEALRAENAQFKSRVERLESSPIANR